MIIDIHEHAYLFEQINYLPNASDSFLTVEKLLSIMDAKGIDKAVLLPLANAESPAPVQNVGELLQICKLYPERFIPFCNIDPRLPKDPDKITADDFIFILNRFKDCGCKGIGEITARVYIDSPCMMSFFKAAGEVGLPALIHMITPDFDSYGLMDEVGLKRLECVIRNFPKLKMIGHSPAFWNEISGDVTPEIKNEYPTGSVKQGGTLVRLLREYQNLYCDMSAGSGLNALQRDPDYTWKFIEEFQDRLMLGLDHCSVTDDIQHIEWLTNARKDGNIKGQAYEKLMWKNANKILGLGLE
ncbi:MAG: hypothetical protein A2Y13_04495 [Planctomycetes bacterium GWC2_45_44]|nr:MAG: hypothetical protein A2Y13_04495 [Planctomycetes bacterium GWC2_45_44]HBR19415.1 hypothetical protein [Phycisphaerales bacterium]